MVKRTIRALRLAAMSLAGAFLFVEAFVHEGLARIILGAGAFLMAFLFYLVVEMPDS